jgi:3'(2'), 5'-bisphosphate nucleotidase
MTKTNRPYERELTVAISAVRAAARLCRAVRAEISPEVLAKKDKSPVTVADFGSQALICRALIEAFPDDPVIAEEDSAELKSPENRAILDRVLHHVRLASELVHGNRADIGFERICEWIDHGGTMHYSDRFWTLDPIDGTKGFLRSEQYAVALALIVHGEVVVAALACPQLDLRPSRAPHEHQPPSENSLGMILSAVKAEGAFARPIESGGGIEQPASRLQVNDTDDPAQVRFCESIESGHSAHGDSARVAQRLGITRAPLRMDSQAKYAAIARGEAEIYLRLPTSADYREKIWDHAAGVLIVTEAGGAVTDIHGRSLEFHHGRELSTNRGVIVSNNKLHTRVIQAIEQIGIGSA